MDLVYTAYRGRQGSKVSPDWLTEGNTVSVVSSQNILLFATTTQLTDRYGKNCMVQYTFRKRMVT